MIREKIYKFFNYFSLLDFILLLMITALGVFSWSQYHQERVVRENVALAKLQISSDDKRKTFEEYFRDSQKKLVDIVDNRVDKTLFKRATKDKIYVVTSEKNIGFVEKTGFENLEENTTTLFTFTGFTQEKSYLVKNIVDSNGSSIGRVALELNSMKFLSLFTLKSRYKNYLINNKYQFVDRRLREDKKLHIYRDDRAFESNYTFNGDGLLNRPTLGYHEYFKLYNIELAIVSEVESEYIFKSLYERRNNILVVLISFLFFAIFVFVRSRYKAKGVVHKGASKIKDEKKSLVVLWDQESFNKRFEDMKDMKESIIELYIEDTMKQVDSLKNALKNEDRKKIKHYAHTIKGASLNLSAVGVENILLEIERLTDSGADFKVIEKKVAQLEKLSIETIEELKGYLTTSKVVEEVEITNEEIVKTLEFIKIELEDGKFISYDSFDLFKLQNVRVEGLKKDIQNFNIDEALVKIDTLLHEYKEK
jgi:HPt (histidine-containing phosphotransfer) domain-containing protein